MPQILFLPDGRTVEASISESILSASLRAGIPHTNECRGNARCSTCRVLILNGLEFCCPRNEKEQALAAQLHFAERVRLACQTTILGNVAVRRLILDANDAGLTDQRKDTTTHGAVGEERGNRHSLRRYTKFNKVCRFRSCVRCDSRSQALLSPYG